MEMMRLQGIWDADFPALQDYKYKTSLLASLAGNAITGPAFQAFLLACMVHSRGLRNRFPETQSLLPIDTEVITTEPMVVDTSRAGARKRPAPSQEEPEELNNSMAGSRKPLAPTQEEPMDIVAGTRERPAPTQEGPMDIVAQPQGQQEDTEACCPRWGGARRRPAPPQEVVRARRVASVRASLEQQVPCFTRGLASASR